MKQTIQSEYRSVLSGHRFFWLFLFLLATLFVYPFAEANRLGYYAFRVLGSAVILISVYAANLRRSLLIVAIALAIPAFLQRILLPRLHVGSFSVVNSVMSLAFDVVIVVMIFRQVFAREAPSSETIFGALCVYLIVGFSFASIYGMIAAFEPKAFYLEPLTNLHAVPDRFDFIYYSFGTMTSLGAAGITPVAAHARSVTIIEAIVGVLYLAVLIARLMGAYRSGSRH